MIKKLVVNGCSYMEAFSGGNGHVDLAQRLGIDSADTLAIGGSANSRIIRTTLKHSYLTTEPTFYIMGLTFINRWELPILQEDDRNPSFEGRWCNPQNQEFSNRYEHFWDRTQSERFVDIKLKTEVYSMLDRTEDLMYNMLAAMESLQSRGHKVLVYQQADNGYHMHLGHPRLKLLSNNPNIIGGFKWCAVGYQHDQGVEKMPAGLGNFIGPKDVPDRIRHPMPGHHAVLNEYLVKYINDHNII